jgi:hypothetical protein
MNVLVKMVHGSTMYGTNTPESDMDYKGVYLPHVQDLMAGFAQKVVDKSTGNNESKNTKDDVDFQLYPLQKFLHMLAVGDMVALDMLHATPELTLETSPAWKWLQSNKHLFYTKNMAGLLGYVRGQVARYGMRGSRVDSLTKVKEYLDSFSPETRLFDTDYLEVFSGLEHVEVLVDGTLADGTLVVNRKRFGQYTKLKNVLLSVNKQLEGYGDRAKLAAANEGVDWKAVSHAFRATFQLEEMLTTRNMAFPLQDREFLKSVKRGDLDFVTQVQPLLEERMALVERLSAESTFPDEVSEDVLKYVAVEMYLAK